MEASRDLSGEPGLSAERAVVQARYDVEDEEPPDVALADGLTINLRPQCSVDWWHLIHLADTLPSQAIATVKDGTWRVRFSQPELHDFLLDDRTIGELANLERGNESRIGRFAAWAERWQEERRSLS